MARILRIEPYDPDAVDADNDGIVQEGTAWERPAGSRLLDEIGNEIQRGFISNTRPRMRVVGFDGADVDYRPSYGISAPGTGRGKVSQMGKLGFPSLSELGYSSPTSSLEELGFRSLNSSVPSISSILDREQRRDSISELTSTFNRNLLNLPDGERAQFLSFTERIKRALPALDQQTALSIISQLTYWATYLNDIGVIGAAINDVVTGTLDGDEVEGLSSLVLLFKTGGKSLIDAQINLIKEKWNVSREKIAEFKEAFYKYVERMKIKAGELNENLRRSITSSFDAIRYFLTEQFTFDPNRDFGSIRLGLPDSDNLDNGLFELSRRIDVGRQIPKRGNRERAFKKADEKAKELSWTSGDHFVVETDNEFFILSKLEHDKFIESLGGKDSIPDSISITQYTKPNPEVNLDNAKELLESFNGPKKTDIDDALYREHATSLHYLGGSPEDVPDEVFAAAVFDEEIVDSNDNPLTNLDGDELTFEDILTGNFGEYAITDDTTFSNRRFEFRTLKGNHGGGFGGIWTVFKVTDKQSGETWYVKSSTYGQHDGVLESVGMELASELGFAVSGGRNDIKTSLPIQVIETPEYLDGSGETNNRVARWTAMRSIDDWVANSTFQTQMNKDGDVGTWFDAGQVDGGLDQSTVDVSDMAKILVFDYITDNLDRHSGNFKVARDQTGWQRIGLIDNGLMFGGRIREFPNMGSYEEEATPAQLMEHADDRALVSLVDFAISPHGNVLLSEMGVFGNRIKTDIIGRQRDEFEQAWKESIDKMDKAVERILSVERFAERGITLTPTEIAHLEAMKKVAKARLQSLRDNPMAFYDAMDAMQKQKTQFSQVGAGGMSGLARLVRGGAPTPSPITHGETWA